MIFLSSLSPPIHLHKLLSFSNGPFNGILPVPQQSSPHLHLASDLFDEMPDRDVPAITAKHIQRCAREGRSHEALSLFRELAAHYDYSREPYPLPVSSALSCCASVGAVKSGKELHGFMIKHWTNDRDLCCSGSSLVRFYANCGLLSRAREVFDRMPQRDVVSWTIMLMAYADQEGCENEVMALLLEMLSSSDITPNCHTLTVVLPCATLEQGKQLHALVVKNGWGSDAFVGSALIDLYSRNGILSVARLVFDAIKHKDTVCYNSLISAYGHTGTVKDLVSIFNEMVSHQLVPNRSTFIALLSSCASFGFLGLSKQFHARAVLQGFSSDDNVQAVAIDMYAKSGDLKSGLAAFERMGAKKNIVAWNSMICGYGKHGQTKEALEIFNSMVSASIPPNHITFTCLLSACSHSGFIHEGWKLFNTMTDFHGIAARNEHYSCIVDLLGRAGMVRKAYNLMIHCDHELGPSVWGALLNACVTSCDAEIGEIAARKLFELEPDKSASYVGLASIFAANGRWAEAAEIRELMDFQGINKDAGYSWIEIGSVVHKFRAGKDMHCAKMKEIQSLCSELNSCVSDQLILGILVDDFGV